ncbi:MAG: hypothetical protein QNJ36_11555 [Calothrix sp. MO_167.B42]|nr:hypothetical protein [Calothrix sp. MO_167.B42]
MKPSKLPIQAAPVERTITGALMSSGNGVEASGILDTIGDIAKVAAPIAAPILGSLI